MIIGILNQKGGVGKTTLAINLTRAFQVDGFSPLLVDADPQGSTRDWHEISGGELVQVIAMDRDTLIKNIGIVSNRYNPVIIDGPARIENISRSAIVQSDIILIPVQPSPYDIWATADLVSLIKQRQEITGGTPKAFFVITRVIKNTHLSKSVQEALLQYDIPILKSTTTQLQAYPSSATQGQTVYECGNKQARDEIQNILTELKESFPQFQHTVGSGQRIYITPTTLVG